MNKQKHIVLDFLHLLCFFCILTLKIHAKKKQKWKEISNWKNIYAKKVENNVSKNDSPSNIDNLRNYSNNPKDKNESNDQIKNIIQSKPAPIKNEEEPMLNKEQFETINNWNISSRCIFCCSTCRLISPT